MSGAGAPDIPGFFMISEVAWPPHGIWPCVPQGQNILAMRHTRAHLAALWHPDASRFGLGAPKAGGWQPGTMTVLALGPTRPKRHGPAPPRPRAPAPPRPRAPAPPRHASAPRIPMARPSRRSGRQGRGYRRSIGLPRRRARPRCRTPWWRAALEVQVGPITVTRSAACRASVFRRPSTFHEYS
jgi:hypothetical protein